MGLTAYWWWVSEPEDRLTDVSQDWGAKNNTSMTCWIMTSYLGEKEENGAGKDIWSDWKKKSSQISIYNKNILQKRRQDIFRQIEIKVITDRPTPREMLKEVLQA